jgi:diaminopimelate epimerase
MISFYKMHASGNDFVILDNWYRNISLPAETTLRQWAHRNIGIGFDQLLYLNPSSDLSVCDAFCRIFNASGSEAEQCGNGIACLVQFLYRAGYVKQENYRIAVPSGCYVSQRINGQQVSVDLGHPVFDPSGIPFQVAKPGLLYSIDLAPMPCVKSSRAIYALQRAQYYFLKQLPQADLLRILSSAIPKTSIWIGVLAVGNPHCIVLVPDINHIPEGLGKTLSEHPCFPNQSNVGFVQVVTPNCIKLRVYERGVGETSACGSGACAAVIVGRQLGCLQDKVTVQFSQGGCAQVSWPHSQATVQLETATQFVFQGEVSYS